jgi:hypothetical protein
LSRYSTISVTEETKRSLEEAKGDMEWSAFLLELLQEADEARRIRAFNKLRALITEEEIESIKESSREFREGFRLR